MLKIATPVSPLFADRDSADAICAVSDCLEARENIVLPAGMRAQVELFHSDLEPAHEMKKTDFALLRSIKRIYPGLKLLSFHCASVYDKPLLKKMMFFPGARRYGREEMLKNASVNFKRIREVFGSGVKMAVENTNYYPTPAYDFITDADFISSMVRDNRIYLLYDIAHARITAHNRRIGYSCYKASLPMDRVVQVHLSAPALNPGGVAFDSHELPVPRDIKEAFNALKSGGCRYLTVEYYKNLEVLLKALKKIQRLKNG